jgi:hypothetical protein
VVVDTLPGGAVQVTNPPLAADAPPARILDERVRIGAVDGAGPEVFGNISALAVDARGRILVLDAQAAELRIFGPDGAHLRTVGGRGAGPGEFRTPVGLTLHPEGGIWVVDPGNGRYAVMDAEGEAITTVPRPVGFFAWPWPGGFDHGGTLFDVAPDNALVRLDGDMGVADTIALGPYEVPSVSVRRADGAMIASVRAPFRPARHWRFDPRGFLWSGVSDAFRIARLSLEGDTLAVVRLDTPPLPVSAAEADSASTWVEGFLEELASPGVQVEGDTSVPETKPAFATFVVDDGGRLWVEPTRRPGEPRHLLLFREDGVLEGAVAVDEGLQLNSVFPVFRNGTLTAVVTDALGTPQVVQYRIVAPGDPEASGAPLD